jgi:hypothetical protein
MTAFRRCGSTGLIGEDATSSTEACPRYGSEPVEANRKVALRGKRLRAPRGSCSTVRLSEVVTRACTASSRDGLDGLDGWKRHIPPTVAAVSKAALWASPGAGVPERPTQGGPSPVRVRLRVSMTASIPDQSCSGGMARGAPVFAPDARRVAVRARG